MSLQTPIAADPVPFEEQTADAVARVRQAFVNILRALPQPVRRACELHRALRIDKGLGWRIFKVIGSRDPFAAARYVPGASGVKIFLQAAQKQGVPVALTDSVTAAISDYRKLQRVHAGNRKRLDMLLAAHSDEGRAELDAAHRRLAYEGSSYVWGASADVHFRTTVVGFSETPGELDVTTFGGLIGLQRLRSELRWLLKRDVCTDDEGKQVPATFTVEPLYDAEHPDETAAKLFMSSPPPRIVCRRIGRTLQWELLPSPVGRTRAVSCVTGAIMRRCGHICQREGDTCAMYAARVRTPAELLIVDMFIHRELFGVVKPTLDVYGGFADGFRDEIERILVRETVQHLGKANELLHTPEIPGYSDMRAYVFDRLGWEPEQFDVYRLRMEYPVMLSEVRLSHPLRE